LKYHFKHACTLLAVAGGLVSALPVSAAEPNGRRMYVELGQLVFVDESMPTGELRWGSVTPLEPGLDFVLPFALEPALIAMPDLDLALPIAFAPGARVVPRAGVSALLVYGGGIGGYALGWNAGAGLVLNAQGPVVLRVDYTLRAYGNSDGDINGLMHAVSAGIGFRY
jgi:hypothetical protein